MAAKSSAILSVANSLKDTRRRFLTRYTEVTEGVLATTGQRVYHSTLRMDISRDFDEDDMLQRLRFLVKSGVRLGHVLHFGIDVGKTPYVLTEWRKLEPVTIALRHQGSPADVVWQIASQIEKLHRGGMPFGDVSEETFLIDSAERVYLCGIPAYGLHAPIDPEADKINDYLAPEHARTTRNGGDTDAFFAQDTYAIGVCAHHLFARKAFPHPSSAEQLHEYLNVQTPNLLTLYQTVPPWALGLIRRCIDWDPEERASIAEIREIARQGTTLRQQISRLVADFKDFPLLRVNWRAVANPTYQQICATALFAFAAIVFVIVGTKWFHQWTPDNLRAEVTQAYGRIDEALASTQLQNELYKHRESEPGVGPESKAVAPDNPELEPEEPEEPGTSPILNASLKSVVVAGVNNNGKIKPATRAVTLPPQAVVHASDFQRYVVAQTAQSDHKSRLWATPQKELISLLTRAPGLPRSQFYTVASEILARNTLNASQKLALLALLHLDPSLIPPTSTRALINLIDGTFQSAQVADLIPLMVEDIDYVLAAILAQTRYPSTALQAYQALACRPLHAEQMRSVLALAKRQHGVKSVSDLQAIGLLALGQYADEQERVRVNYRLLDRTQLLDVLLVESGMPYAIPDAPWCPLVEL